MMAGHQPRPDLFPPFELVVAVSSRSDGSMGFRIPGAENTDREVGHNREQFLRQFNISTGRTALCYVTYARQDFTEYRHVQASDLGFGVRRPIEGQRWHADALVTNQPDVALFLPLADCGGAVIYDKAKSVLMLSHLGRHSTLQDGAQKSVEFLKSEPYGCDPSDLKIWLSPGVGKDSYAMDANPRIPGHHNFVADNRWRKFRRVDPRQNRVYLDIPGYNRNGFLQAGVPTQNIEVSQIDTAKTNEYPSHSQGDTWRMAVVAMMRADERTHLLH
jgi:copper oxidase (laccase) domain-containing protein